MRIGIEFGCDDIQAQTDESAIDVSIATPTTPAVASAPDQLGWAGAVHIDHTSPPKSLRSRFSGPNACAKARRGRSNPAAKRNLIREAAAAGRTPAARLDGEAT
jgi:hypothetical protein